MRNSPFTFAPWLPLLFHHAHWDQTEESLCPSLGSRPTLAQGPSAHVPLLFGTTFHYLSVQPPRLPPSEDVSKRTFSTLPYPRRHRCALLPVDVTERLQRFRIWTPIWLLRHWAWLRDIGAIEIWLIDWLICGLVSSCLDYCNSILSQTLISQGFSMFRIDWLTWWQSLLHLLAVFHCFFPIIDC